MTIGELKAAIQATGLPDDAIVTIEDPFEAFDISYVRSWPDFRPGTNDHRLMIMVNEEEEEESAGIIICTVFFPLLYLCIKYSYFYCKYYYITLL